MRMGRTLEDGKDEWLVYRVSCRGTRTEEGKIERVGVEGIGMVGMMLVGFPPIQVDFWTNCFCLQGHE